MREFLLDNPNWIVPTPPAGDSSHRVADTEFVTSAVAQVVTTTALASGLATTLQSAYAGTTGFVLQTIYNDTTSLIASNSAMAGSGTASVPTNTDGVQILSATITPISTTNSLLIRAIVPLSNSASVNMITALFQDSTATALVSTISGAPAQVLSNASLVFRKVAATTGPTIFALRVMNFTTIGSTWAVNGFSNPVGTALASNLRATIVIQETKA